MLVTQYFMVCQLSEVEKYGMCMQEIRPFHIAVPVRDIEEARKFYTGVLGFEEGRSDSHWIDFNMYGHQYVVHYKPPVQGSEQTGRLHHNPVDGHEVPVPHCGVVLKWEEWEALAEKLRQAEIEFVIEPYVRFKGQAGEQATLFFLDPSGNALEFKSFKDPKKLFSKDQGFSERLYEQNSSGLYTC